MDSMKTVDEEHSYYFYSGVLFYYHWAKSIGNAPKRVPSNKK